MSRGNSSALLMMTTTLILVVTQTQAIVQNKSEKLSRMVRVAQGFAMKLASYSKAYKEGTDSSSLLIEEYLKVSSERQEELAQVYTARKHVK